jgi:hypothetical protein
MSAWEKRAVELEAEVGKWLETAEATDAEEDTVRRRQDRRGDARLDRRQEAAL